jgi:hypothetical protein
MKNIHVLPTDRPSIIYKQFDELKLRFMISNPNDSDISTNQVIHITSSDEIKEGDWIFNNMVIEGSRLSKALKATANKLSTLKEWEKIILTTDPDLIKDGVQAIDDEFLEWFVKNPSCEWVELEVDLSKHNGQFQTKYGWKIIIPQEEPNPFELPKALPDEVFYESLEPKFEDSIENSLSIMSIANDMFGKKEEPKQETIEEAAEKEFPLLNTQWCIPGETGAAEEENLELLGHRKSFIKGAKWQAEQLFKDDAIQTLEKGLALLLKKQERMYSEEEVLQLLLRLQQTESYDNLYSWFEQFKKK